MTESALLVLRMAGICTVTDFVSADLEDLSKTCAIPYKVIILVVHVHDLYMCMHIYLSLLKLFIETLNDKRHIYS